MKQKKKWKDKSLFSKFSDIFFVIFIIALIIPASRKNILASINSVKSKIIPPKSTEKVIDKLTENDYYWKMQDLNGQTVTLNDFKGKVIFINFWATWCGPCIGEMPEIQKFYDKFKNNNNVAFIIATSDDLQTAQNFIKKKGYSFPVFVLTNGVPKCLEHNAIPTSFLINKKGEIVLKQKNVANWGGTKMENNVKKLLED